MAQPFLVLQELSKYYVNGRNVVAGLNKVSLSFERGEFVAITGESGSGKSTLAHILGGILPYEDGELCLEGKPTSHYDSADWERYRAESVGFISQSYGILPGATVEENVVSALRLTGMAKEQAAGEARALLEEVELWPMRSRRAAKLSSGQKQRLSIARALAKPCELLIADEPTGNLDPENSEKVIRLLAKAAQDRLVILITHEFSEAEDFVTRHIQIQDGRISADARLREAPPVPPRPNRDRAAGELSLYTAALQLRSRPAWSAVVILFLTLTAFAAFAFLGSFIVALDDTSTRIYDSGAFLNGDKCRVVAVRKDGQSLTEADYETILSLPHVQQLERFGYITDICYVYQEGVDYEIYYETKDVGSGRDHRYMDQEAVRFLTQEQFLRTVPLYAGSTQFLTGGRLPEQFNEVVAAGDESLIGSVITVHIWNTALWSTDYLTVDMTVVGVTEQGQGLYFHEDVGRALTLDYLGSEYTYIPWYDQIPSTGTYINYRDSWSKRMYGEFCDPFHAELVPGDDCIWRLLADDEIYVSVKTYVSILSEDPQADFDQIYAYTFTTETGTYHVAGLHDSSLPQIIAVSPDTYQRILTQAAIGNGDQVSITISDYAYTDRVITALEQAGYFAMSPYVLGSTQIDPELAAQRTQTLYICIGALLAVLVLQLILLRALFAMTFPAYRTMSDLGLRCSTAQRSLLWQILGMTLAGQVLAGAGICVCAAAGIRQIADLTKYLHGLWWPGISLIHLASTALAAWVAAAGLKKRVYPRTGRRSDIAIDDEDEEVAQ